MSRIEKTIFISYRRTDISWALAVYQYLTNHKYDVFFDYTSIPSGDFEQIIVSNIRARAHFVLILTPTALDRCSEPDDWLRREIETAIDEQRNIIPLFFDGFRFGSPSVAEKLTGKLTSISRYNGLEIPSGYFTEAMERLSSRYLNVPLEAVLLPVSTQVRKVVKEEQIAVNKALVQKWEEIKEILKPADENSGETSQEKNETISQSLPSAKRIGGGFQRTSVRLYGIGAGILLIAAIGSAALYNWIRETSGTVITSTATYHVTETRALAEPTASSAPITRTVESTTALPSKTFTPTVSTPTPSRSVFAIGGADKLAFISNKEIWLMNVDGSAPIQLTNDGEQKSDLQFLDHDILLFISETSIKYIDIHTGIVDILTTFPSDAWINSFRVSHDGQQAMISLKNEIFVISFDFDQMKNVHSRKELLTLDSCHDRKDWSQVAIKEALWSLNDQTVAWLFRGPDARNPSRHSLQVGLVDITRCDPQYLGLKDNFPALRFSLGADEITAVDWDGKDQFVFNTTERNSGVEGKSSWQEGWGKIYVYNSATHRLGARIQLPGEDCCYRDARWSPDGKYVFFAFQDYAPGAPTLLYYVPYDGVNNSTEVQAIPLPEGFFKSAKEAPQLALHSAQQ